MTLAARYERIHRVDILNLNHHLIEFKYLCCLFNEEHEIIISTARSMGSFENNSEFAKLKQEEFTKEQLANWGVKHHKLYFGKHLSDFYIVDKASP